MSFGKSKGGGRRDAPREPAPLLAVFFTLSATGKATVVDVSRTGARLRGNDLPGDDEELIISIDGLRTYGRVIWSEPGECGVAFTEPLPAGSLQKLRHSVSKAGGLPPEIKAAFDDWTLGVAR